MRLNRDPSTLQVGDLATSDYYPNAHDVVRKIVNIKPSDRHESGFVASADAGETCKCCGQSLTIAIQEVDASWFIPKEANNAQSD